VALIGLRCARLPGARRLLPSFHQKLWCHSGATDSLAAQGSVSVVGRSDSSVSHATVGPHDAPGPVIAQLRPGVHGGV
jgi:hypothetical protein